MTATKLCSFALCAALLLTPLIVPAAPAAAQVCDGDCNDDRSVAVDEIILGVRIALGDAPLGDCQAMDADGDGAVTVNDLLAAVTHALQGCGGQIGEAAQAASARVATEPLLRLFDFQTRVGTPGASPDVRPSPVVSSSTALSLARLPVPKRTVVPISSSPRFLTTACSTTALAGSSV